MKNYPLGVKQHSLTQFHFVLNTKLRKKKPLDLNSFLSHMQYICYLATKFKYIHVHCTLFYNTTKS